MTKGELRAHIAQEVRNLPPAYVREADEAICQTVLASPIYQNANAIFCYIGTAREINTRPILTAALRDGKLLALPRCVGKGIMEARQIVSLDDLEEGRYGIPAPGEKRPLVSPEAFNLAVIPCATGNRQGRRLGYGGGYYDRYLPGTQCPTVLLCRERLVREDIPVESHDLLMDYLVTETGIWRTNTAEHRKGHGT